MRLMENSGRAASASPWMSNWLPYGIAQENGSRTVLCTIALVNAPEIQDCGVTRAIEWHAEPS